MLLTDSEKSVQSAVGNTESVVTTFGEAQIFVDGKTASADPTVAVYTANGLVYYEADKDFGGGRFDGEIFGGTQTLSAEFVIAEGCNMFSGIAPMA